MTISKRPPYINVKAIKVKIWHDGTPIIKHITARQVERTLLSLIDNSKEGITSLELSNTWAVRLSQYIKDLRDKHGLNIEMVKEENKHHWHGRYFLHTPVDVLSIETQ